MNDQIKQIAQRIAGLREVLEIPISELAQVCGISEKNYLEIETGIVDIPVSMLHQISQKYDIELSTLMFGEEPRMASYYLTRNGKGPSVSRTKAYKYQSLASGFINRKADPFLVTVEPIAEEVPVFLNSHPGQEFNLVTQGRVMFQINEKKLILEEGDSIYFDATRPHGMKALDGKPVKFVTIII